MRIPKQSENLQWCKTFTQSAFRGNDSKFYFNDTISINNIKMHLAEFDATFYGKETFSRMFFININENTIIGNINCHLELKEQWNPITKEIFESIKIK